MFVFTVFVYAHYHSNAIWHAPSFFQTTISCSLFVIKHNIKTSPEWHFSGSLLLTWERTHIDKELANQSWGEALHTCIIEQLMIPRYILHLIMIMKHLLWQSWKSVLQIFDAGWLTTFFNSMIRKQSIFVSEHLKIVKTQH